MKWEQGDSGSEDDATDRLGDERKDILEGAEKSNSEGLLRLVENFESEELITGIEVVDPTLRVTVDEDEPSTYTKVKGRRNKKRKMTLKPREKVSKDDDGWVSDDSVVTELWEVKKEGAKKYFEELSKLEVKAKAAYAELTEALASVDKKQ